MTRRIDPKCSQRGKLGDSRRFQGALRQLTGRRSHRPWLLFSGDVLIATCQSLDDAEKWSAGIYRIERSAS